MKTELPLGSLREMGAIEKQERRDAAENRATILQTAEMLFAEHGVAQVNMADIAQAAEVGKGTLYRRFANKGELCLALMDSQLMEFQNVVLAQMREMTEGGESKLDQLDHFLDALVYFTDENIPLLREVQHLGLVSGSLDQQRPHYWQHMTVSGLLQSAISAGELPANLDVPYCSDAILATLRADVFQFQRQSREFTLERISEGICTFVAGLKVGPSPNS